MAKKSLRKSTNELASEAGAKQSDRAYPAEPHELNGQRQRLKKAAVLGAEALKPSARAATPDLYPAPARQVQTIPVKVAAPHASRALAAQPAKPPIRSEQPKSPEKAAVVAQAPKPTATKTVNVSFVLFEPDAKQVSLCGDFNCWASGAAPMQRHDGGHWELTVALAPGRHEYKFVVDGHWIPDPLAHEHVWNHHGTLNSVIEVRA